LEKFKFTLEKQDFPKEKLIKKANKICQRNYVHNNINEVEKIEIKKLYSQMASEFVHFRLSNLFCFLPLQKNPLYRVVPKIKFQNKYCFSQLDPLLKELGFSMCNPKLTRG